MKREEADEKLYLEERAEAELELAQGAEHAAAVRAHYLMAGFYLDQLHKGEGEGANGGAAGEQGGQDRAALRRASDVSQRHGDLAADYVAARIEAARTAGDEEGVRLWERVIELVEHASPARARTA